MLENWSQLSMGCERKSHRNARLSECETKQKPLLAKLKWSSRGRKGNMLQQKYECSRRPSNRSLHRYMFHHRQNHRCHLQPAPSPPPPQCLVVLAAGTANSDALIRLRNCLMQLCRSSETPPCVWVHYRLTLPTQTKPCLILQYCTGCFFTGTPLKS